MARGHTRQGALASATLAAVLFAVVAAGGGCEVAIGSDVPDFECVQGPAVCPGNEVCDPVSHQCVAPCTVTGCSAGLTCDPVSSACIPVEAGDDDSGPGDSTTPDTDAPITPDTSTPPPDTGSPAETGPCRGLTCPCSGAASCNSGICADSATVPSSLYAAAGNQSFCSQPCCTSADCDANSVCFATGGAGSVAGNYCVSPTWLNRLTGIGTGNGGSSCSTGRNCRSGLCANSVCVDTCCTTNGTNEPNQCATGTSCRFDTFPGAASFDNGYVAWCGPAGTGQNGSSCSHDTDCASNLCGGFDVGCSNACRNTADCSDGESCTYVTPTAESTAVVAACLTGAGTESEGTSCSSNNDCKSQMCSTTTNECTDVCFANSDCTKSGWRCRPEAETLQGGGKFEVLACGP